MTERHQLAQRLGAIVDELAYPYSTTSTVDAVRADGTPYRYRHITRHPSLLDQLASAIEPSVSADDGARGGYDSTPPARLAAIDRAAAIRDQAREWLDRLRVRRRPDLAASVRMLAACARDLPADELETLVSQARAWRAWARVLTGWDTPAWAPHGPCPVCEVVGTIRVRLATAHAACVECGAWWDRDTIATLADYIALWSVSRLETVDAGAPGVP